MNARRLICMGVLLCFTAAARTQAPQTRDRPQTRPMSGGQGGSSQARPSRPESGNRPGPGGSGGPQIQPPRPGGGRPNPPSRPKPPTRPNPPRPTRPIRPNRPPQWGQRPQNRPSYSFRGSDRDFLRCHYQSHLRYINRARRPHFVMGGFFPYADIGYLSPLPPTLYGALPPPPLGYSMGYFDGYVVVYDPVSYFIANVVDLLQY